MCAACMDQSAWHLAFNTSHLCGGERRFPRWDAAASARGPHTRIINTQTHPSTNTQSLSHAEIRGADWRCLAKEEKRPFRLFACWLTGCCISVLWCWQLNTSRLTVETGYDQSLKISACAISSLISSDSSPAGPTQNSSLSIIHRTNTRRSTGKWEPREW